MIWLRRASTDSMAWSSNYPVIPNSVTFVEQMARTQATREEDLDY